MFDPTPFTRGTPREARSAPTPPQIATTVEVSGERWNGISRSTPGVCHLVVGPKFGPRGNTIAACVSACGLVVAPHTYGADEVRPGCAECLRRGA